MTFPAHYGDNFVPVIASNGVHTPENPFCVDPTCPCHEDQEAIGVINDAYQAGLVSADDATRIVQGKTL